MDDNYKITDDLDNNNLTITASMLHSFAENIEQEIKNEFKRMHLSGNLMKTTYVMDFSSEQEGVGYSRVYIPAVRYDLDKYIKEGTMIKHPEWGSYANELELNGSFAFKPKKKHRHKGYVGKAIEKALSLWAEQNNMEIVKVVYSSHASHALNTNDLNINYSSNFGFTLID